MRHHWTSCRLVVLAFAEGGAQLRRTASPCDCSTTVTSQVGTHVRFRDELVRRGDGRAATDPRRLRPLMFCQRPENAQLTSRTAFQHAGASLGAQHRAPRRWDHDARRGGRPVGTTLHYPQARLAASLASLLNCLVVLGVVDAVLGELAPHFSWQSQTRLLAARDRPRCCAPNTGQTRRAAGAEAVSGFTGALRTPRDDPLSCRARSRHRRASVPRGDE